MKKEIESYLQFLSDKKKAPYNTLMSYERDLRYFRNFLDNQGRTKLRSIGTEDIRNYLKHQQENGMAISSISRSLAAIRSFFKYCYYNGLISEDPSNKVASLKQERRAPEILSQDDVKKLLEQPKGHNLKGKRDRAMLETLYATGIRVSELINLKVDHVDIGKKSLRCITGRKTRDIPVNDKAIDALTDYLQSARIHMIKCKSESNLFVNCTGMPMTRQGFWKIVKEYAKSANVDMQISPHILRHSFAAHQLASGADLNHLKELLGHADIAATQVYLSQASK